MSDVILDRRDLSFQLFEVLDTDSLFARPRFEDHSRETIEAALDTAKSLLPQNLRHGQVKVVPLRAAQSEWVFRARLDGYSKSEAEAACRHFRDCITISPKAN